MVVLAFILGAYLLGSLPQVYLLGRLRSIDFGRDSDLHESLWNLSHSLGAVGFLIDLAKGPIAVVVGWSLGFPLEATAVAGLAVVLGQMWPVYFLRSGGMGNSIGMAMAAALTIYPFLIALIPALAGLGWRITTHLWKGQPPLGPPPSRSLPLGMAIAFGALPLSSWLLNEPLAVTFTFVGLFLAIMIRRLTRGTVSQWKVIPHKLRFVLNRLLFA